jgi:imidazole glycerol-phosphate synthase subunit HisF
MYFGAPGHMHSNAKWLRKNPTKAEEVLWQELKKHPRGFKFRRQHPIAAFVADFYCHRVKLIIEVDGSVHEEESTKRNDKEREWNLEIMGLTIIRFKNEDVLCNLPKVMDVIKTHLVKSSPSL